VTIDPHTLSPWCETLDDSSVIATSPVANILPPPFRLGYYFKTLWQPSSSPQPLPPPPPYHTSSFLLTAMESSGTPVHPGQHQTVAETPRPVSSTVAEHNEQRQVSPDLHCLIHFPMVLPKPLVFANICHFKHIIFHMFALY
jgi:hypothetical protein